MKLVLLVCTFVLLSSIICAQPFYKYGTFVIKGHVDNPRTNLLDVSITTYFWSLQKSIKVSKDGSFEQVFPIQNKQEFRLMSGGDIASFMVQDKDTITLQWDDTNTFKNISIEGKNEWRSKELQTQLKLNREFYMLAHDLFGKLKTQTIQAAQQYQLINNLYNRHVQAVFDSSRFWSDNLDQMVTGIYFMYSKLLLEQELIPHFKLSLTLDSSKTYPQFNLNPNTRFKDYTQLNEDWFYNVPAYRAFVESYLFNDQPFKSYVSALNTPAEPFNPTLEAYYLALSKIHLGGIRDWYIASSVIHGFAYYNFADVEKVYKQSITTINTPFLKDTLRKFYLAMKHLRPGSVAPNFSLKNDKEQTVSLSNFKGKVVYIDFWGVGCGPCIAEIERSNPQLHQRYKNEDVVFVNICVDANPDEWIEAIKKYKLDGVNLIAEGWSNHPVCKAYNITSIPHCILIDKNGNIADNNAPWASFLNSIKSNNKIDLLLK